LAIFGGSVVLCACTFLSDESLSKIGLSSTITWLVIGIASSFVLFISIVELCVDWRERSRQYGDAAERLARHKLEVRQELSNKETTSPEQIGNLKSKYQLAMDRLPRIPDSQFVKLKAYHLRKVRLSQMINTHIGCPVWLLRLRLFYEGICGKKVSDKEETS
jgi:hypothetical protein